VVDLAINTRTAPSALEELTRRHAGTHRAAFYNDAVATRERCVAGAMPRLLRLAGHRDMRSFRHRRHAARLRSAERGWPGPGRWRHRMQEEINR